MKKNVVGFRSHSLKEEAVLTIYFIICGLVFIVVPWTQLWPKAVALPGLLAFFFSNPWFRGFISGLGLVLFLYGLLEIARRMQDK